MRAGKLPRPWISGSATVAVRMLQEEQPPLLVHTSVGARARTHGHLDTGHAVCADEDEFDVLRDIFMRDNSRTPTHTSYDVGGDSFPVCSMHSQEYLHLSFQLESCIHVKGLSEGMLLHHHLVSSGLDKNSFVHDRLARMYGRCESFNDAFYCFDNVADRGIDMWSFMIGLHFKQLRDERTGVQLFWHALNCNVLPDTSTILSLLSSCKDKEALARGKQMHVLVNCIRCESDVAVGTALLSMYSRCDRFEETKALFDKILEKSIVSWNAMIAACVQHDSSMEAIQLFIHMQQEGLLPNIVTFVSTASACARELNMPMGKSLHTQALNRGLDSNASLATAFVYMYGKCGSIENAGNIFQEGNFPCVILWTGMLNMYCQHGHTKEAFYTYSRMQEIGILPNEVTFLCILSACNSDDFMSAGQRIHAQIFFSGIECDTIMLTALAVMYGKRGNMEESDRVFNSLAEKSIVTWNAMILMYIDSGRSIEGIQCFSNMLQQGVSADDFTLVNVLHACTCALSAFEGKKIHQHISHSEFRLEVVVCNALIDMYGKCKLLSLAQAVFDGMHQRNTVSWNTLMAAYSLSGYNDKTLMLFNQMLIERICPDAVTFACIVSALAQSGCLLDCWSAHSEIIGKGFDLDPVVTTHMVTMYGMHGSLKSAELVFYRSQERHDSLWNALIMIHVHRDSSEVFELLDEMRNEGFIPSSTTLASCISGGPDSYALTKVKQVHVSILHVGMGFDETVLCALACMYAGCGDLQRAWSLFSALTYNLMVWNCMLGILAEHAKGIQAWELFIEMQQQRISLDATTSLNLLSACRHSGLVENAFGCVTLMRSLNCVSLAVFHYDCIVDLLGRVGQVHEAMNLIHRMPFKPTAVTWTSLLGACTVMSDRQGGECAARYLLEVCQDGFVPYILLSRLYIEHDNSDGNLEEWLLGFKFHGMVGKQVPEYCLI